MEDKKYKFLVEKFLVAMNEIGQYGEEKYKAQSFYARALRDDRSRGILLRTRPEHIAAHASEHFEMYLNDELHDHFNTLKHQLAAVAFNAMMEFYFAGLEDEEANYDKSTNFK